MSKLIYIKDKAVIEAIKNMYLDFKNSPIKGNAPFVDMLRKISTNNKIDINNAGALYSYVDKALRTQKNCLLLSNQNFIDMQKECLMIMEWLEIYFKVDGDDFYYKTEEEIEDALLDKYHNSEEYLQKVEEQSEQDAETRNNEAISHPDYPQDFS